MSNNKKLIPQLRFPDLANDEEWATEKLYIISEIIMGSSPNSSSYNENKIGLPLLQGNADIKKRQSVPRIYTTEVTKECKIDDILLSVRAPVGTVAKSLHKACIGRGISALRALKPNSQEYLYQWLFSYETSWQKVSQGGTFDAVNSDDIRNLLVPTPKPHEQQRIASCLSSLDEVIAAHSLKLELLKDHKKGLMQNLFPQEGEKVPKYRFKEFEKEGDWVEKKLGEVVDFVMGNAFKSEDFVEDGLQLIRMGNLYQAELQLNRTPVFLPYSFEKDHSRFLVRPKDLLMSMTGTMGKRDYGFVLEIPENSPVLLLNQRVLKIIPKKTCNRRFALQLLKSDTFLQKLYSIPGGTKQANLSTTDLKEIKILFTNLLEQQKIASCLSSLDALITAQAEKIEQLKLHKKGLMQGLFPKIQD